MTVKNPYLLGFLVATSVFVLTIMILFALYCAGYFRESTDAELEMVNQITKLVASTDNNAHATVDMINGSYNKVPYVYLDNNENRTIECDVPGLYNFISDGVNNVVNTTNLGSDVFDVDRTNGIVALKATTAMVYASANAMLESSDPYSSDLNVRIGITENGVETRVKPDILTVTQGSYTRFALTPIMISLAVGDVLRFNLTTIDPDITMHIKNVHMLVILPR
jgi:hypothetical protein